MVLLTETAAKTKLNLACGNRILDPESWVNHDRWQHRLEISACHDLRSYPWPWPANNFDTIQAMDIMEHMPEALPFIEELWRIAKPDAKVYVHTSWASPSIDNRHTWRDPTHVRPFTEESMAYFDPIGGGFWFENYGKFYTQARFEVKEIVLGPPDCIGFRLRVIK